MPTLSSSLTNKLPDPKGGNQFARGDPLPRPLKETMFLHVYIAHGGGKSLLSWVCPTKVEKDLRRLYLQLLGRWARATFCSSFDQLAWFGLTTLG